MFALVLVAVVVGAIAQRVSGLGFALVVSPIFVLILGAFDGVMVVNLCGAVSAGLAWAMVRRDVDWQRYRQLVIPALLGVMPGSLLAANLPEPVLELSVGVLLITALTLSLALTRTSFSSDGLGVRAGCGFLSGVMSASVGVSGAAMGVYAIISRCSQRVFTATMQPFFVTVATSSFIGKLIASEGQLPALEPWQWAAIIVLTIVGLFIGQAVSRFIPTRAARAFVIVIAYAGAVTTLVNGILSLS